VKAGSGASEEPVVKPKERKKLLVLGGNGFVDSHVCMEALSRGMPVVSLSWMGWPDAVDGSWANNMVWVHSDLFDPARWQDALEEVQAVVL
jgi:nucleoside-diphosphate-sugar epimerase